MTGQLLLLPADAPVQSHTHLCVDFVGGDLQLRYRDPRRFGFLALRPTATVEQEPPLAGLGPEPLEMSLAEFRAALGGRRGRIKALLLSQGVIAGLGNIYADEVLFAARLHPEWPAESLRPVHHRRLYEAIQRILRAAVEARGSSINNYVSVDGRPGGYQAHHQVYGRTGQPCPGCGTAIRRILAAGRSTHFCPRCQRRR
jgi:formamidopyrimidine-DNA glycosylase